MVSAGVFAFSVYELYSEWKRWVQVGDNSKYPEAFRTIGGDPIGSGQSIGFYLFMRNDLGWRGVPPNVDGVTVRIDGSFFGESSSLPIMEKIPGNTTTLVINHSALVTGIEVGGTDAAGVADAVWGHTTATDLVSKLTLVSKIIRNKTITDPSTGVMTVYDDDSVTPLLVANLREDAAGAQAYRGQGAERRERLE